MFDCNTAIILMNDLMAANLTTPFQHAAARNGGGGLAGTGRHIWTRAVYGTRGVMLSFVENRNQQWSVGIGDMTAGRFKKLAAVKEIPFSNFFEAANFFVNEACPAAKIYS